MIAFTSHDGQPIYYLDVKTTFLNGGLTKEVYIKQHEAFQVKGQEGKVCKLQKMLYGLRQAPHAWHTKIDTYLHNQGLIQSEANANVYFSMKEVRSCC
jgi:hypothetical protein